MRNLVEGKSLLVQYIGSKMTNRRSFPAAMTTNAGKISDFNTLEIVYWLGNVTEAAIG